MAVMAVNALSGHEFVKEDLDELTKIKDLQRAELKKGGTHVDIYFTKVSDHCNTNKETLYAKMIILPVRKNPCPILDRKQKIFLREHVNEKVFKVTDQKNAVVEVYNYYKPQERVRLETVLLQS